MIKQFIKYRLVHFGKVVYADEDDIRRILWTYYVDWCDAPMSIFDAIDMNCKVEMCLMDGEWRGQWKTQQNTIHTCTIGCGSTEYLLQLIDINGVSISITNGWEPGIGERTMVDIHPFMDI